MLHLATFPLGDAGDPAAGAAAAATAAAAPAGTAVQRFGSRKLASASTLQAARTEATVAIIEATAARMAAGGGGGGGAASEHARMRSSQGSDEAQDDADAGEDVSAMVPVGATEHIPSPKREAALGGQPTLCPGCHHNPSLRVPWESLP